MELEILAAVLDQLTLTANVGWLDAEWDDFSQDLNNNGIVTDNSFLDLPNAPDLTMFYAADYVAATSVGKPLAAPRCALQRPLQHLGHQQR